MALYDGLPLNTPTLMATDTFGNQTWATRTPTGGTVENRLAANSPDDISRQLDARTLAAITTNSTYLAVGVPTNPQLIAQVQTLTQQVQALLRLREGQLGSVN